VSGGDGVTTASACGALAVWIPGGSENSGRPSMGLKIENFTDDCLERI
jgi:hypothetical protein